MDAFSTGRLSHRKNWSLNSPQAPQRTSPYPRTTGQGCRATELITGTNPSNTSEAASPPSGSIHVDLGDVAYGALTFHSFP